MSKLNVLAFRPFPRLKLWGACSIGILLLCAMLFLGASPALASPLTHNTWSSVAPMPTARAFQAASAGHRWAHLCHWRPSCQCTALNTVEAYSPKTNTWSSVAPMPTVRYGLAASLGIDGRIYAIGGIMAMAMC